MGILNQSFNGTTQSSATNQQQQQNLTTMATAGAKPAPVTNNPAPQKSFFDEVMGSATTNSNPNTLSTSSSTTTYGGSDPVMGSVDSNQTVQGQLTDLLDKENPLMQRAYYKGLDYANGRGLLNSSMAAEAAQNAMIDSAMPVAQQDASTFANQSLVNQGYENQFALTNRQLDNSLVLQDDAQGWQSGENDLNRTHDLTMQNDTQAWQGGQNDLNREHDLTKLNDTQDWQSGENDKTRALTASESEKDRNWKTELAEMGYDFDGWTTRTGISANLQGQMFEMLGSSWSSFDAQVAEIMAASNIDGNTKTQFLGMLDTYKQSSTDNILNMFQGSGFWQNELSQFGGANGEVFGQAGSTPTGVPTVGSGGQPTQATGQAGMDVSTGNIESLYVQLLGRSADPQGVDYWKNSGLSMEEITNAIKQTAEYKARGESSTSGTQNTSNQSGSQGTISTQVIDSLYVELLGRTADSRGLNYWLNSGLSMEEIKDAIKQTDEYQSRFSGGQ